MMEDFLLQLLRMSLSGTIVALVVMLARLLIKKAPRAVICALWTVVLFRLACPFTIESAIGFFPAQQVTVPQQQMVYNSPLTTPEPDYRDQTEAIPEQTVPPEKITLPAVDSVEAQPVKRIDWAQAGWVAGACVWAAGLLAMALHGVVSLAKLKKSLVSAVEYDKGVYLVNGLPTAFVLGVFKPKIYLPAGLEPRERSYILMHEHTHIRRGDPVFKLLGYVVLCVHWFNPVVWLAFLLSGRDLEMACDEAVIRKLGAGVKKEYSASLLHLATGRRSVEGMLLAFGEGETKGRVKNVLKYKKPAIWVVMIAVIVVAGLCIGLACNQPQKKAMVRVGYEVYEWDGDVVSAVPAGSISFGMLESILHNHSGKPEADMQGVNLDEKYVGCLLYGNGSNLLYLETVDGTALELRLAEQQEAPVMELNEAQAQALLGTGEAVNLFQITQMQGSRVFAGYAIGDEGDMGVMGVTQQGDVRILHSTLRVSGENLEKQGAAQGALRVNETWYEVLLVTDPVISHAVRTDEKGVSELNMEEVPAFYVLERSADAQWAFYDAKGQLLELQPFAMPTETDSVGADAAETNAGSISSMEYIVDGNVQFLCSILDEENELGAFLEQVKFSTLSKSAAWPITEGMRPNAYIVVNQGDVKSGLTQFYIYDFPELGHAVVEYGGVWTTLSDAHWEMLCQVVSGASDPCVYTLTQGCVGVALNDAVVLQTSSLRSVVESIWASRTADAETAKKADRSALTEYYELTRTGLDGKEESILIYQNEGAVYWQTDADAIAKRLSLPSGTEYSLFSSLFPESEKLIEDLDGDGRSDIAWWGERSSENALVTLHIALGNGQTYTREVQAMWGHSLAAADVTGDGVPELIAMADTGGNGGEGCWALEILTLRDGYPKALEIPSFGETSESEPNWEVSGYHFQTQFEDYFKLHVRSEQLDEVINLAQDEAEVQYRLSTGQFDADGKVLFTYPFEDSGCDGICAYELVVYERASRGYALRIYQYLYQWSHVDGVGYGVTTLQWDEETQKFIAVEQDWVKELPRNWVRDKEDFDGDGQKDLVRWISYAFDDDLRLLMIDFAKGGGVTYGFPQNEWATVTSGELIQAGTAELIVLTKNREQETCVDVLGMSGDSLVSLMTEHRDGLVFSAQLTEGFNVSISGEKAQIQLELSERAKAQWTREGAYNPDGSLQSAPAAWLYNDVDIQSAEAVLKEDGKTVLQLRQCLQLADFVEQQVWGVTNLIWNGSDFAVLEQWFEVTEVN